MATMEMDGYVARVDYDEDQDIFHGRVENIADVITFEGKNTTQLRKEFQASLAFYRETCKKRGTEAKRPYSGQFILRIDPKLHRAIAIAAEREDKSLNAWAKEKLELAAD